MGTPIVKSCDDINTYGPSAAEGQCWVDSTVPNRKIKQAMEKYMKGTPRACRASDIVFTGWRNGYMVKWRYQAYGYYCLNRSQRKTAPKDGQFVFSSSVINWTALTGALDEIDIIRGLTERQIKHAISWYTKRHMPRKQCSARNVLLRSGLLVVDKRTCRYIWSCWKPGTRKPKVLSIESACVPRKSAASQSSATRASAVTAALVKPRSVISGTKVYFTEGRYSLTRESRKSLARIATLLKKNRNMKIEVGGHASQEGTPDANLLLSSRRAVAVYRYLIKRGVGRSQLTVKGYGTSKDAGRGRAVNRRVEFKVK